MKTTHEKITDIENVFNILGLSLIDRGIEEINRTKEDFSRYGSEPQIVNHTVTLSNRTHLLRNTEVNKNAELEQSIRRD